jgi:hypothetical protein
MNRKSSCCASKNKNLMNRIAFLIFICLLVVYIYNLAPDWGAMAQFNTWDGLEYIICSHLLGIDHPPGHPFYLLLGKLFTFLPFGGPSWNINLISALFGAVTVAVFFLVTCTALVSIYPGNATLLITASTSLTFAFSYVFWSHCEIPEVHTLFLSLLMCSLYFIFRWRNGAHHWLYLSALALALGIGVNILGSIAVFIPLTLFVIFTRRARSASFSLLPPLIIFLAGLLFYLYYPIRLTGWPLFSHPMNYLCPYKIGSLSWYFWYMTGKAWTGGQMFFLARVIPNIPLYLKFAMRDLGMPVFLLSIFGIALALRECPRLTSACIARDYRAVKERILLPSMLVLFLFLLLPEISIHDPSNPRATDYLMNFFIPSLLILAFFGTYGALKACSFLNSKSRGASVALILLLAAMPVYQFAVNLRSCDLRGKHSAYILSLKTLDQIPDGSIIVSKLVYPLVVTYFSAIEPVIAPDKVSILDPELVSKKLVKEGEERGFFSRRNNYMLDEVNEYTLAGRAVFLAGDIVDEDKSPEKLLISDLDFEPWQAALSPDELRLRFPRELFIYRVMGLRTAKVLKEMPEQYENGIANKGTFVNGVTLLGFVPRGPVMGMGREVLNFDFYWSASEKLTDELYVGMIFMNSRMQRLGEPCWHTLGGVLGAKDWAVGEIFHENCNVYPPPLPAGRCFITIGMVNGKGHEVKYLPADHARTGKAFDYVLLMSFEKGAGN